MFAARTVLAGILATGLAGCLAGCRGGPAPDPAGVAEVPGCPPASPDGAPGSTFALTVVEAVDPDHAPRPRNRAEAAVFRLAYETLVDVDCDGTVRPGLAVQWTVSDDGTEWTFRLRKDAWFAHVDLDARRPVDAAAIVDAWREMRRRSRESGEPRPPAWSLIRLRDLDAADPRVLVLRTASPVPDLLARISGADFAVATRTREPGGPPDLRWPQGTRGVLADPRAEAAVRDLVWWPEAKDPFLPVARITVRVRPDRDPRDEAVDATDLLLADATHATDFLRDIAGFRPVPLPWDRTYVLATPEPALAAAVHDAIRLDLATDVLAVAARPASGAAAADAAGPDSTAAATLRVTPVRASRLHYAAGDEAARALAARLSVTAIRGAGTPVTEWPGDPAAYRPAAGDAGIVLGIPRPPGVPLAEAVAAVAPWLADGGTFAPLVDTRASLAVRDGFTGWRAGADGAPRLERAGWRTPPKREFP